MRMLLATFLLAFPAVAFAQETFVLKLPPQGKGDVHRVSVDMEQTIGMQRLDTFGAALNDRTNNQISRLAYVDEFLDADKGEITRFRRRFESAIESANSAQPTFLPIHGKTLLVDRRNATPQVTWEDGKPITDGVAATLEDALKEGKDKLGAMASFEPLPGRPVTVGDSWNIDVSAIVKDCEDKNGCKLTGATGVGILRQIYPGAKGPCAKVEVKIRVPLHTIKNGDVVLALSDDSGSVLEAVYDFALGGTDSWYESTMHMTFKATGKNLERDGSTSRLRVDLAIDMKEQRLTPR
jgi:hypothetical protein